MYYKMKKNGNLVISDATPEDKSAIMDFITILHRYKGLDIRKYSDGSSVCFQDKMFAPNPSFQEKVSEQRKTRKPIVLRDYKPFEHLQAMQEAGWLE